MVFTEEDKTFTCIKILYLIIGYGLRDLCYEKVTWQRVKRSGLDNLIMKLLKKWMANRKHNCGIPRTERIGLINVLGLKLLCW